MAAEYILPFSKQELLSCRVRYELGGHLTQGVRQLFPGDPVWAGPRIVEWLERSALLQLSHSILVLDGDEVRARIRRAPTAVQALGRGGDPPSHDGDPITEFSPSEELASYVVRAWRQSSLDVAELQGEVGAGVAIQPLSFERYSDRELTARAQTQLSNTIHDVVAAVASVFQRSLASQDQEKNTASVRLTHQGRFRPFLAPLIVRHFPIGPNELDGFLRLLFRELRRVAESEQYGGPWGRLGVSPDSEIVLTVTRPVEEVVTHRRRAKRVQWLPGM